MPVLAGRLRMVWQKLLSGVPVCKAKPIRRGSFTAVLAAATLVGLGLNFVNIDPIRALFWAAIINGVVAVPVMIVTCFYRPARTS